MNTNLKELTADAGRNVYGFRANSRSLRPVHFAHPLFNHCLDYTYEYDSALLDFWDKPSKQPASELDEEIRALFDGSQAISNERIDRVRRYMRLVLDNDDVLYNNKTHNAPTCSSDWLVTKVTDAVTVGRFLYELIARADDSLEEKLTAQLRDHHDGISLLMRPLIEAAVEKGEGIKVERWDGPEMEDAGAFGTDKSASNLVEGFNTLNHHLRAPRGAAASYPHDLERVIRFASFALYLYMINRNYEIRADHGHDYRVPLLLNYTGDSENMEDASVQNVNLAHSEVENATRFGVREKLDQVGMRSFDEEEVLTRLDEQSLIGLNRDSQDKIDDEYETLYSMYEVEPATETFDKLVNILSNAIHDSTFNTYPPRNTVQTFGWRIGLLKPRGNRAARRWFEPSAELLETLVLATIEPGSENRMTLPAFCTRLRERFGIVVGGTPADRDHLDDWNITVGADADETDPLNNKNYRAFEEKLVELDYATKYADGVTLVEVSR